MSGIGMEMSQIGTEKGDHSVLPETAHPTAAPQ
jgi:hypothetical protein